MSSKCESFTFALEMAVQILNDMPDAEVHRGEPVSARVLHFPPRVSVPKRARFGGRAGFIAGTIALHMVAFAGLLNIDRIEQVLAEPAPITATLMDAPRAAEAPPPEYVPPPPQVQVVMPIPQEVTFDAPDAITLPAPTEQTSVAAAPSFSAPPLVDSVEYVRPPKPVYPNESSRRHERGTVVLRVLVDTQGRPAQIQVEQSSGFDRLDMAARDAVQRAVFRPHEVNGVAQAAQVLIPIEFSRRAS